MKPTGGRAFPSEQTTSPSGHWNNTYRPGMTLRDYFAGQALVGMADYYIAEAEAEMYARRAYLLADAMLAEREKK